MHFTRRGSGPLLLLVHGIGGSGRSWDPIAGRLAEERSLILVDLPGHGQTPALAETSIATYADALEAFLDEQDLRGVDMAGSSMGARLVLELARRGSAGNVVALDPGGFWTRRERRIFGVSVGLSVKLVRLLEPVLPFLTGNPITRTVLLGQFSSKPWALDGEVVLRELRSFLTTESFEPALRALSEGPPQEGTANPPGRVVAGWGKRDLVTLPRGAARFRQRFPTAEVEWYPTSGHFPYWDAPEAAVATILRTTGETPAGANDARMRSAGSTV